MDQLYQRMDEMMDRKLENVYSELKAISKTVDPDYYSEEEEDYDYESTEDEDEPIRASMARLQSEKFWIEGRCIRLRDGMFSGPENMPIMMLGMLPALKIAVPFQNWLREMMEDENKRALADPSCSAMERRARLNPPPGSMKEMLNNTFKVALSLQGKPLSIKPEDKDHAAMFFSLGDIYMTD